MHAPLWQDIYLAWFMKQWKFQCVLDDKVCAMVPTYLCQQAFSFPVTVTAFFPTLSLAMKSEVSFYMKHTNYMYIVRLVKWQPFSFCLAFIRYSNSVQRCPGCIPNTSQSSWIYHTIWGDSFSGIHPMKTFASFPKYLVWGQSQILQWVTKFMHVCQEHLTLHGVFLCYTLFSSCVHYMWQVQQRWIAIMCKTLFKTSFQVRVVLLKMQKSATGESTKEVYLTIEHQQENTRRLPSTCCICSRCFTLFSTIIIYMYMSIVLLLVLSSLP